MRRSTRFLVLLSTLLCFGFAVAASAATVQTNRLDYYPGENVVISGSGWQPGEVVSLLLHETPTLDPDLTLFAQADANGDFVNAEFYTDIHDIGVSFTLTATGVNSLLTAQTTFTDSGANLDQWANLTPGSWVNGNLGASKSTYYEGNSIPYRLTFGGLTLASHTVTIEWDTTKSGKHAIDYLTSFIQPNPISGDQPNPCLDVGCDPTVFTTYPIPADPQVTGAGVTPVPGVFTMYGGTITHVSAYSYANGTGFSGDKSAMITITFTATVSNPVLAWGGHISARIDWGANNSAVAISGSPYHTRLIDLDGSGGNQDRSLSADAVIFPGQITIIKSADPEGSKSFSFAGSSAPLTSFTLTDDGTTANNTKIFAITDFKTYTVTETVPSDWKLDHITCTVDQDPIGGSSASGSGSTATITLKEGAFATCTFFNIGTRLTVNKIVVPSSDTGLFNLQIDGSTAGSGANVGNGGTTGAVLVTAATHTVGETAGTSTNLSNYTTVYGGDCDPTTRQVTLAAGDSKTCTITNTRKTHTVKLVKSLVPSGDPGKFDLTAAGTTATAQGDGGYAQNTSVAVGTTNVTVSEIANAASGTNLANYTSSLACVGVAATGTTSASFTMPDNDVTCTVTNTRDTGSLKISKVFDPLTSGFSGNFTIHYACDAAHTGDVSVAAGGSQTISGIPTGTLCTVSEPTLPTAPTGWTFGTPTLSPADGKVTITTKATEYTVTVTNTISRDTGKLTIAKTLSNPDGATVPASFSVNYNCGTGYTGSVSVAAGGSATVSGIPTGNTCSITEAALTPITGYTWGTPTYTPTSIVISNETGTFTLNVANSITRDRGALQITKTVLPSSFSGSFGVHVSCSGDGGAYDATISYPSPGLVTISNIPTGNTCTVTETSKATPTAGYTWQTEVITGSPAVIVKGGTATVTVANTLTGLAKVVKTASGALPTGTQAFTFQIRQGASTIDNGTTIASGVANASNNGEITFSADLAPGATYQICEIVMPAWTTTLGDFVPSSFNPPDGTVPNPNVDNSILCGNFTVNAGDTKVFAVDNTPPPGGRALTIGFWKNWASCSGSKGGQEAVLDATLLLFPIASGQTTHGVYIGKLYVDACEEAVAILDKRTLAGKKVASDPLFNMAAQLMAAELNLAAGAYRCPRLATALDTANALLTKYNFAGNFPYTPKIKPADATAANNLAKYLDDYNNNRTGVCP